jgi:two-component system sensor histidine kinase/response regulator
MNLERQKSSESAGQVLVVDDMSTIRIMLSQHVRSLGHQVVSASNGREALELLRTQSFDLVLLDVMMPEMDGYAVLEQIKATPSLQAIPVLMISSLDEMESVVRCIESGADDYLPKPFNLTLLRARIGASLEKKRLWDQLGEKYRQLQELEQLRDSLTDMLIHDLRTPLTSFLTGLYTVNSLGAMTPDQQWLIDSSISGGQTLLEMINDLLDVSKMEEGSLRLNHRELQASDLVERTLNQMMPLANGKNIRLTAILPQDLPSFYADEEKLQRTLVNLLGNAIKFTPTGGEVITIVRQEDSDKALIIAVKDTGEGIPKEAFERIFEKFGQVETRKAGRKMSSGLGLTFCKMAVEAHGGRIWVESEPEKGSTFSLTIPLTYTELSA